MSDSIWSEWVDYGSMYYGSFENWYDDSYGYNPYGEPGSTTLQYDLVYSAPQMAVDRVDTFTYTVADAIGNESTGQVNVVLWTDDSLAEDESSPSTTGEANPDSPEGSGDDAIQNEEAAASGGDADSGATNEDGGTDTDAGDTGSSEVPPGTGTGSSLLSTSSDTLTRYVILSSDGTETIEIDSKLAATLESMTASLRGIGQQIAAEDQRLDETQANIEASYGLEI